ncbi:MAG: hydrolase Nlp/P60 [Flavobacteriaceae bacterium]|nr:MAG: hydrolase Nlp/P60 [Flavobacteriaceae bacterium]
MKIVEKNKEMKKRLYILIAVLYFGFSFGQTSASQHTDLEKQIAESIERSMQETLVQEKLDQELAKKSGQPSYQESLASFTASLPISSNSNVSVDKLIEEAKTWLGVRYVYGGTTRGGIDCSAFTQNVFSTINVSLPRVSSLQAQQGYKVSKTELQKGDLVFFSTSGRGVSHVGIVTEVTDGVASFIHASSSHGVMISKLTDSYWSARYLYGKHIL